MRSKATTVTGYLEALPKDRREAISAVRKTILKNLPQGYEEAINWGLISYQVPLEVYSDTYNKQPLMYAGLASQKNYMAVYLLNVYGLSKLKDQLVRGFKAAGKKLDMGKSCIRFKKLDDLPLDVIGKLVAATPMAGYVAFAKKVWARKK
ncbi:MAG: DUF1801 domain-containing protein [Planctomycetes bacterium]|nr:DUF1801 domain-containing protein [Planctomycetota bacterium]